jgi:pre-mRNA-splicing factor 38A
MGEDRVFPTWSFTQDYKRSVHNMAPQHLIDTITRHKIYNSVYWQQFCFGLNLITFIDRTQMLQGVGGLYGHKKQPCNFYCLFLKLLELEPSESVISHFLSTRTWQMKYLRLIAALYVRFTFSPDLIYITLEPFLTHYNQIAVLHNDGYQLSHFDEVIQNFLRDKFWCGITFPPLPPRSGLPPRVSPLRHLTDQLHDEVYRSLGLTPDGQLLEEVEEKRRLKVKGLKLKKSGVKKSKKVTTESNPIDEIAEENRIRAMLGLPLLK